MIHTVLSSATREIVIGFDRPFTIIGERINPTGRKLLAEEMRNGDFSRVERDALAQVAAGAHMLDVNAGIPMADEPALLVAAIKAVCEVTDERGFVQWVSGLLTAPLPCGSVGGPDAELVCG